MCERVSVRECVRERECERECVGDCVDDVLDLTRRVFSVCPPQYEVAIAEGGNGCGWTMYPVLYTGSAS